MSRWREIQAAKDAEVRGLAHAFMRKRAFQIMPKLDPELADKFRRALLGGSADELCAAFRQVTP